MAERASNQRAAKQTAPITPLDPGSAYRASMLLLHDRFAIIAQKPSSETSLMRAERMALQVTKIVEGVAYSCLSALERCNQQTLRDQRTKDADKLLIWLKAKRLLRLPNAQRLKPPPSSEYKIVLEGAGSHDLDSIFLRSAYSRSSELIHERHPERLSDEVIQLELAAIEADAAALREWLWLHVMFLRGEGFLVQMGQFGTSSFMVPLTHSGDLPPGL